MATWSKEDEAEKLRLLTVCRNNSGEHLPTHHGKGSWATTYSNAFIDASVELWKLHGKNGTHYPQYTMSRDFQSMGIRSCRGAIMNATRVEYLFNAHLKRKI